MAVSALVRWLLVLIASVAVVAAVTVAIWPWHRGAVAVGSGVTTGILASDRLAHRRIHWITALAAGLIFWQRRLDRIRLAADVTERPLALGRPLLTATLIASAMTGVAGCASHRSSADRPDAVRSAVPPRATETGEEGAITVQFDTKGAPFERWVREFLRDLKHTWHVPVEALGAMGQVVVAFDVWRDGRITDIQVTAPSSTGAFNESAYRAIEAADPTQPLPSEYPEGHVKFTVTFRYVVKPPLD